LQFQEEHPDRLQLVWRGARFPALLCLGIALALLAVSIPVGQAIWSRGLESRVGSLWYFPVMNLILLAVAIFLLSLRRTVLIDRRVGRVFLSKENVFRRRELALLIADIVALKLGTDEVYSGFSAAGSTASQSFPVPSLRLALRDHSTVLLDRGGQRRLEGLGRRLAGFLALPLTDSQ
jgi:hypothetical protein